MNKEEQKLYNRVQSLVKKANMRILRLERETGIKSSFAVKELEDYLDEFAISKTGRIMLSKKWDITQLKIVDKAVRDFLESGASSVGEIKKFKKEQERVKNKTLTYQQVLGIYRMFTHWTWILDELNIDKSEFFSFYVQPCNLYNWSEKKWVDELSDAMLEIPDKQTKEQLKDLYNYFKD